MYYLAIFFCFTSRSSFGFKGLGYNYTYFKPHSRSPSPFFKKGLSDRAPRSPQMRMTPGRRYIVSKFISTVIGVTSTCKYSYLIYNPGRGGGTGFGHFVEGWGDETDVCRSRPRRRA